MTCARTFELDPRHRHQLVKNLRLPAEITRTGPAVVESPMEIVEFATQVDEVTVPSVIRVVATLAKLLCEPYLESSVRHGSLVSIATGTRGSPCTGDVDDLPQVPALMLETTLRGAHRRAVVCGRVPRVSRVPVADNRDGLAAFGSAPSLRLGRRNDPEGAGDEGENEQFLHDFVPPGLRHDETLRRPYGF